MNMETEKIPPLYSSDLLTKLIQRWANTNRITKKLRDSKSPKYLECYKLLQKKLAEQPAPFEFNKRSIDAVLQEILK